MLTNATATGASAAFQVRYANRMTFQASGTTTAGATSRETAGNERFTLTPVEACAP